MSMNIYNEMADLKSEVYKTLDDKISSTLFYATLAGIAAVLISVIGLAFGVLHYEIYRIEHVETKYATDHDKIMQLEQIIKRHN